MDGLEIEKDGDESGDGESIHAEALERFKLTSDAEDENRKSYAEDVKFSRLGDQWPEVVKKARGRKKRPCLTFNRMPTFIRQVVNDARMNKPEIKVIPCDSGADPDTARILQGLIRNIEVVSGAEASYDTALECAASGGWGYFRVNIVPSRNDVFSDEIVIERISSGLKVYGDHTSTSPDSSDWNYCFVVESYSEDEFEKKWPKAGKVSFEDMGGEWIVNGDEILVAEYWTREASKETVYLMPDNSVVNEDALENFAAMGLYPINAKEIDSYRVKQYILNGQEIIEENDWPGDYIPIVPVYGEEIYVDGKRYLRSMIADSKDAQRAYNYWRTSAIEKVALDVKAPFIGPKGSFSSDPNWATASTDNHAYLEYDGGIAPQRVVTGGVPAGDLQMAAMANDDLKATIGLYDASLGNRSNETSGVAIQSRQRQGDISTFHFIDNLGRAIKHCGRILVDLIPHVFTGERIVRVLGEDGEPSNVQINQPFQLPDGTMKIYDITAGKYDVTVSIGPAYSTKRQEAALQMTEFVRAFPPMMQFGGDLLVKNLDWPGAEELSQRLRAANPLLNGASQQPAPQQGQAQPDPMVQMQQQFQAQAQQMQNALMQANQKMAAQDQQIKMLMLQLRDKEQRNMIEQQKVQIQGQEAQVRMATAAMQAAQTPNLG